MCTSTRWSTRRRYARSIARAPPQLGLTQHSRQQPPRRLARRSRCSPTSGSTRRPASPITSWCRRRSTHSVASTSSRQPVPQRSPPLSAQRRPVPACCAMSPSSARACDERGQPLQHPAGLRRLRQRAGPRPRRRRDDVNSSSTTSDKQLPPGNTIAVRGQVESMNTAFSRPRPRPGVRGGAGLPADGGQLSELATRSSSCSRCRGAGAASS